MRFIVAAVLLFIALAPAEAAFDSRAFWQARDIAGIN